MGDKTYIQEVLRSINMSEFEVTFIGEEFDKESFENLDYEALKSIIPKAGPRQKFWIAYRKKFFSETLSAATTLSIDSSLDSLPSLPSTPRSHNFEDQLEDYVGDLQVATDQIITIPLNQALFTGSATLTCPNYILSCISGVDGLLASKYYENNNILNQYHRHKVANLIIQKELESFGNEVNFKISADRFNVLARSIHDLFVNEKIETYFVPYKNDKNTKQISRPSGLLYEAYCSLNKKLRKLKTIKSKEKLEVKETCTDAKEKSSFLSQNLEPWEKIRKLWIETHSYRKELLDVSIQKYFDLYPILRTQRGYILLCQDFDLIYTKSSYKLFASLTSVNNKIVQYVKCKKSNLLELVINCGDLCGFLLLPHLLSCSAYSKGRDGKRLKLSSQEILDSFILLINDVSLLTEKVDERRTLSQQCKETLQPFIVVVGPSYAAIKFSYVVVNSTIYNLETPFSAIDTCFKAFSALQAEYPKRCHVVWLFIQQFIYEITTDHDKQFTTLNALMSELQQQGD